ncbi:hypothetical protein T11_485 [Trichinella zimbabwensis]|uniref:Uncharacterized protein n=1 Tax=Trichinella zimbabwensis TaxID=268475 RepID=A0A0V1HJY1_9BILA|nr:hypothetical protein T11_485 [Trichinella zimbabwensis]
MPDGVSRSARSKATTAFLDMSVRSLILLEPSRIRLLYCHCANNVSSQVEMVRFILELPLLLTEIQSTAHESQNTFYLKLKLKINT